jgi:DNA-binding NarL/FixJ family response regulator
MGTLRILIADDHSVIREGLKTLFESQSDLVVVGEAERGEEACRLAVELHPDVLIMDVSMPGLGGAKATKRLKETCPGVKVVAFSAYEDEVYVRQLLAAGASGYILKRTAAGEIARAVRVVAQGGLYLDPFVARKVMAAPLPSSGVGKGMESLSDREEAVLRFTARGLTNKEMAELLGVSIKTIETYKARMGRKVGLTSRADMVRYALAQGWLQEDVSKE